METKNRPDFFRKGGKRYQELGDSNYRGCRGTRGCIEKAKKRGNLSKTRTWDKTERRNMEWTETKGIGDAVTRLNKIAEMKEMRSNVRPKKKHRNFK